MALVVYAALADVQGAVGVQVYVLAFFLSLHLPRSYLLAVGVVRQWD